MYRQKGGQELSNLCHIIMTEHMPEQVIRLMTNALVVLVLWLCGGQSCDLPTVNRILHGQTRRGS